MSYWLWSEKYWHQRWRTGLPAVSLSDLQTAVYVERHQRRVVQPYLNASVETYRNFNRNVAWRCFADAYKKNIRSAAIYKKAIILFRAFSSWLIVAERERERQALLLCFLAFVRELKQSSLFSLVKAFAWWQMCDRSEVLVWISVLGTAVQRCTIERYSSDVFLPRSVICQLGIDFIMMWQAGGSTTGPCIT